MQTTDSVTILKGVGAALADTLQSFGIRTLEDLAYFYPRRYDDYTQVGHLIDVRPGLVTARVRFESVKTSQVRRGLHITTAEAVDDTARLRVTWFNQPYRSAALKHGAWYLLRGEYAMSGNRLQIVNPNIEQAEDMQTLQAGIVPTYRQRGKCTSRAFQRLIAQIIPLFARWPETLPEWMIDRYDLMPLGEALHTIHIPSDEVRLEAARHRLAFEELLTVMVAVQLNRAEVETANAEKIPFDREVAKSFVEHLPFRLTDAQRKTVWQIYKDMDQYTPMNRLVEGDVGSGKTVIAAMAAIMALNHGKQVALLAPTELLARQHAETIAQLIDHTPYASLTALLIGSVKPSQKKLIKQHIAEHSIRFVIGTHALLQEDIDWHDLALVIVDEQHRFGVEQRQRLHTKVNHMPHVLCMTATPIPRSLALTVYGELDLSIVDQSPSHRAGVETEIVSPNSRQQMYAKVIAQLDQGRQAFVVCPLIDESELATGQSAEQVYERLSRHELKNWRVGLLHGRMKAADKEAVMRQFVDHKLDVLVSTTVIEVGVDVPNASVMIIESADRFGLAQAHQLRGRVGRAEHKGYCYLVMSDSSAPTRRIRALESTTDGFKLAELDLDIRGPGALYGTRQHGALDLQIASLGDTRTIMRARAAAKEFFERGEQLVQYDKLAAAVRRAVNLSYLN